MARKRERMDPQQTLQLAQELRDRGVEYPLAHPLNLANPLVMQAVERRRMCEELSKVYPFSPHTLYGQSFMLGESWRDLGKWLEYLADTGGDLAGLRELFLEEQAHV